MAVEIKLKKGDIIPFRSITVYSPTEAAKVNVIARGKVVHGHETPEEDGMYNYLGPVEENENPTQVIVRVQGTLGPIVNYDRPLGGEKAVIHKIDFPKEGIVYVSRSGPLIIGGCGMFGVWQKVGENLAPLPAEAQ